MKLITLALHSTPFKSCTTQQRKTLFKLCLPLLTSLVLCSCATYKTIDPPGNHVEISYYGSKSYCKSIPRVYSGTAYSFCLLNGEPRTRTNLGNQINGIPTFLIDATFSVVTDTIVLPYTLVTQSKKGNIKVN